MILYLDPTGNAGLFSEADVVKRRPRSKFIGETLPDRPRPEKQHIPPYHVEQLGQFVQPAPAQKPAAPRHPPVAGVRTDRTAAALRVATHRAELEAPEGGPPPAQAL